MLKVSGRCQAGASQMSGRRSSNISVVQLDFVTKQAPISLVPPEGKVLPRIVKLPYV